MQLIHIIQYTKWRLVVALCLLTYLSATAQTVKNVRVSFDQSKQLMFIYYDIVGLDYKKEIQVLPQIVSKNTLLPPIKSLSGDLGWITEGGKNKYIIWDAFKDGVTTLKDVEIELKTVTKAAVIPRYWGIELQGSNSAPFGLKVMQLSQLGFYTGFRVGKLPPSYRYTVTNAGVIDYLESGVYVIDSEKRLASFAFTAGPIYQMSRNIYGYVGVGYGAEQLFWKYQAYNLDKKLISNEWALNESINQKGIAMDGGVVVRKGRILFDLGLSTIQFKTFQITAGVGFTFSNSQKP